MIDGQVWNNRLSGIERSLGTVMNKLGFRLITKGLHIGLNYV
jgi:hypothetical protein